MADLMPCWRVAHQPTKRRFTPQETKMIKNADVPKHSEPHQIQLAFLISHVCIQASWQVLGRRLKIEAPSLARDFATAISVQ